MSWRDIPGRTAMVVHYDTWLASDPPRNATVVECGIALGKSLAYLCERLEQVGRDDIIVYGVDPLIGTHRNGEQADMAEGVGGDFALYAKQMMANAPRAFERVRLLRITSLEASRLLHHPSLVMLDNDHGYENVKMELEAWKHADWLGGDDHEAEYPGVERACRERYGDAYTVRGMGGPIDSPNEYNWGTWLRWGAI